MRASFLSVNRFRNCTRSLLRADGSFEALVRQASDIDPSVQRVQPGDQDLSLLYLKLAAATRGTELEGLGQAMPITGVPVGDEELDAIRLWIRGGAPRDATVGGTLEKLGCDEVFDPDPNKIDPLPPPDDEEGVQLYAGAWELDAESEDEVCFATYYDFRERVPPEFQVDCPEYGEGTQVLRLSTQRARARRPVASQHHQRLPSRVRPKRRRLGPLGVPRR